MGLSCRAWLSTQFVLWELCSIGSAGRERRQFACVEQYFRYTPPPQNEQTKNKQIGFFLLLLFQSVKLIGCFLGFVFFYAYFLNLFLPSQINNQVLWSLKILYKNMNMVPSEGRFSSGRVLLALIDMPCLFTRAHVNNRAVGPAYMGDLAASGSSLSHCTVWLDVNKSRWGCVRMQVSVGVWKEDHKVL